MVLRGVVWYYMVSFGIDSLAILAQVKVRGVLPVQDHREETYDS